MKAFFLVLSMLCAQAAVADVPVQQVESKYTSDQFCIGADCLPLTQMEAKGINSRLAMGNDGRFAILVSNVNPFVVVGRMVIGSDQQLSAKAEFITFASQGDYDTAIRMTFLMALKGNTELGQKWADTRIQKISAVPLFEATALPLIPGLYAQMIEAAEADVTAYVRSLLAAPQ